MRTLNARGAVLFELLMVATMSALFAALVSTVIVSAGRHARAMTRALDEQRTLAAMAAWWRADVRDQEPGEIAVSPPDRLVTPHPVGAGPPCAVSGADVVVSVQAWQGQRDPEAGRDLLWLLTDAVAGGWTTATLLSVGTTSCPDGSAALRLTLAAAAPATLLVRAVEPLLLRSYRSGSSWWLGLAPADGSSVVQPFSGPVDPGVTRFAMDSSGVHVFVQPAGGRLHEFLGPFP